MYEEELAQLIDMGVGEAQGRAALLATKGDVMSACERVFSGDFDDVSSENDGIQPMAMASSSQESGRRDSSMTVTRGIQGIPTGSKASDPIDIDQDDEDDQEDEDEDDDGSAANPFDDDDDDNGAAGGDGDDGADLMDEGNDGEGSGDPYSGIFFSKDRTETVIKFERPPERGMLKVPIYPPSVPATPTKSKKGKTAADEDDDEQKGKGKGRSLGPKVIVNLEYEILGQEEWLSGCPTGGEQSFLFQLYNELSEGYMKCPGPAGGNSTGCSHTFKRSQIDFFAVLPTFENTISHLQDIIHQHCPVCSTSSCFACGYRVTDGVTPVLNSAVKDAQSKGKGKGKDSSTGDEEEESLDLEDEEPIAIRELMHCANVQGVIIGIGLHMAEKQFEAQRITSSSPTKKPAVPSKRKSPSPANSIDSSSAGDEYEHDYPNKKKPGVGNGTGYSGAVVEDESGAIAAKKLQHKKDKELKDLLFAVRAYMPSYNRPGGPVTADALPSVTTLANLRRRFNAVCTTLLQNDSLADQGDRSNIYQELFSWLLLVSRHESLSSLLAMPHMRVSKIERKSEPGPDGSYELSIKYEGMASPRELLENIALQAQTVLKGVGSALDTVQEEMDKDAPLDATEQEQLEAAADVARQPIVKYCKTIISTVKAIDRSLLESKGADFVERLKASLPRIPGKGETFVGSVDQGASDEETRTNYVNWATATRFEYADLHEAPPGTGYRHIFTKEIMATLDVMPKRSLVIAKELATLSLNLPVGWESTVFLRVDEDRNDCIKALIIGPAGTPYANAPLVFDIFLPYNYPSSPPSCKIVTTGGGRYRLNPNLYAEGKVCLSLLGTWSGPGWRPNQSTLLQVLISIQSLILVDEPIANEPGFEGHAGKAASKAYNANVRRMVVADAMLNGIQDPHYPFSDVIHTHFKLKAKALREQLDEWLKLDDGNSLSGDSMSFNGASDKSSTKGPGSAFKQDVETLKGLLGKLERGENVLKEVSATTAK